MRDKIFKPWDVQKSHQAAALLAAKSQTTFYVTPDYKGWRVTNEQPHVRVSHWRFCPIGPETACVTHTAHISDHGKNDYHYEEVT